MTLPTTLSVDEARAELVGWLVAACAADGALPAVPLEAENRVSIDLASAAASTPFICAEIEWMGGGQISLGKDPLARTNGILMVAAKVKQGAGTAESLKLLERVVPFLEGKDGTYVRTELAALVGPATRAGWHLTVMQINFSADRISPSPA